MSILNRFAEIVTGYRWTTAVILVAATVLAAAGNVYRPPPRPRTNEDDRSQGGGRLRVATDELGRRPADCFLMVETDDLFQARTVSALRQVVAAVEKLPYVESITWVDTVPTLNVFGLREPLLPPDDASDQRFLDARDRVLNHPLVGGQLLSDDGHTLLMPVVFDWLEITSDEDCSTALLETARAEAARHPEVPLRIRLTGRVPLFLAYKAAFDRNQTKFQAIAYTLVLLLAIILFRGFRAVIIVAAAPALGIFWSFGLLRWMDELANPLTSVVLPVLLTMVGLTDGVHLMMSIRRARADGWPPLDASRRALKQVGVACLLTSLTTAIGFGSLMLAQSEFVQGFGRGCAIGVVVTFFAVVTLIPLACSTRLGDRVHIGHEHDFIEYSLRRYSWIIDFILQHARAINAIAIVSTLGLSAVALTLRPDDRTRDSQPTGSEPYEALADCDKALGGIELVRVNVEWPENVTDESLILSAVQDVERVLSAEPTMRHPLSILNILASLPGDDSITSRLGFLGLVPDSVKRNYFNGETRRAPVTIRIQDLGIARYEPVFRRVEEQLKSLEQKYAGFRFELTGDPVRRGRSLRNIVLDLATSLGTAAIIIFVVMAAAYRSLRIGFICVIPNVFPLVVTATMMVLLGHPLEIASVCSFTVCLGIAVDDTIHFLTRFQDELKHDQDVPRAIRAAFHGVGSAMVVTTLILITGFGTVLTSDLPGHRYFASMAVSTISAALIGDLIFLPAMLARFYHRPDA